MMRFLSGSMATNLAQVLGARSVSSLASNFNAPTAIPILVTPRS
jgi:hypothetical protein